MSKKNKGNNKEVVLSGVKEVFPGCKVDYDKGIINMNTALITKVVRGSSRTMAQSLNKSLEVKEDGTVIEKYSMAVPSPVVPVTKFIESGVISDINEIGITGKVAVNTVTNILKGLIPAIKKQATLLKKSHPEVKFKGQVALLMTGSFPGLYWGAMKSVKEGQSTDVIEYMANRLKSTGDGVDNLAELVGLIDCLEGDFGIQVVPSNFGKHIRHRKLTAHRDFISAVEENLQVSMPKQVIVVDGVEKVIEPSSSSNKQQNSKVVGDKSQVNKSDLDRLRKLSKAQQAG